VARFKPKSATWSITPLGYLLFAVLLAAAVAAAAGSSTVQAISLVVVAVVGLMLLSSGLSGAGARRTTGKTLAQRRGEFGPRARRAALAAQEDPDALWRRERELREQGAEPAATTSDLPDIGI
jgi:hypothetical protein